MQEIRIFENAEFGKVRTAEINGDAYFVGKDVAEILGYSNSRDALAKRVDSEDRIDGVAICDTIGREQKVVCINESGLYSLIFSSKLANAKRFKHWVTSEVLPSIRKTGGYMSKQMAEQVEINKVTLEMIKDLSGTVKQLFSAVYGEKSVKENETIYGTPLKIETFPDEILEQVDNMLYDMQKYQRMNYSLIARFCTMNGYPISSPAIKRYFNKRISGNF